MGYTEYRDLYSVVKAGRQAGTSERKVHHERDNSRLTAARISWVSTEVDGRPDALRSPRRTGRGEGRRSFSLLLLHACYPFRRVELLEGQESLAQN